MTLSGGFPMPSWFDVRSLEDVAEHEDEAGMLTSVRRIEGIIAEESAHVAPARIVLGGFSQGCALSVLTTLLHPGQLGGLVALSGWLPMRAKLAQVNFLVLLRDAPYRRRMLNMLATQHNGGRVNAQTPVFWGHGMADQTVRYTFGEASVKHLREALGFTDVTFQSYPTMGHEARPEELAHIAQFLKRVIP